MRTVFAVLVILVSSLSAQTAPTDPSSTSTLPDGVRISVSVIGNLLSAHVAKNDEIRLLVTNNLIGPGGKVVIPKGAIAFARAEEVQFAGKGKPAKLRLIVTRITWKQGAIALHAYIVPPLHPPKFTVMDNRHPDVLPPTLLSEVGIEPHPDAGTVLYAHYDFAIPDGSTFFIEQMSKPGPSAPPTPQR